MAEDKAAYVRLMAPIVKDWVNCFPKFFASSTHAVSPRCTGALRRARASFLESSGRIAFRDGRARAFFSGLAAEPRQVLRIAANRLPTRYVKRLSRLSHGPGVFTIDWALAHSDTMAER